MLPRCLPLSFGYIRLTVREQITTEDFQDGQRFCCKTSKMWKVTDCHTDAGRTMVNKQHKLTWSKAPGELIIKDLQDGCCGGLRGYHNIMVLAILNFHVAQMPPSKFRLNPTSHSEADEVWGSIGSWNLVCYLHRPNLQLFARFALGSCPG